MDREKIILATLNVYNKFSIQSFPIDCVAILNAYGMKVESYATQSPKKKKLCFYYSEEAYTLKRTVYYNDKKPLGRIRFSLAHEIGHIVLGHEEPRTEEQEKESDCFASYFLAPRMAIHYSGCKNHVRVAKFFNISIEAAQYAFDDYRRWHRRAAYKMDKYDKAMYSHFYNDELKGFVYSIKTCKLCGKVLLNEKSDYCSECFDKLSYIDYSQNDKYFHAAESHWLYGGL